MKGKGKYKKFHCYHLTTNEKLIRCAGPFETLLPELGYGDWIPGTGPMTGTALANVQKAVSAATKGRPKSDKTREKMSAASKGKPKSEEHRLAMSRAHKERFQRLKEQQNAST